MNNFINIEDLPTAILGYFKKFLLPHVREDLKFWYMLGANTKIPGIIAEYMPVLKDAKIVDDAGNIDLDKLHKLAEDTFAVVPKAYIGKFDFNIGDLPQFINFLKNGNQ
jgi:hypothetical protein